MTGYEAVSGQNGKYGTYPRYGTFAHLSEHLFDGLFYLIEHLFSPVLMARSRTPVRVWPRHIEHRAPVYLRYGIR